MAPVAHDVATGVGPVIWTGLGWAVFAWILVRLLLQPFVDMVEAGGMAVANHTGHMVPYGIGVLPVTVSCLAVMAASRGTEMVHVMVAGCLMATLAGLLDDVAGNRSARGLKGHWIRMAEGGLTTGAWKAIIIAVTALVVASALGRGWWAVVDAVLIALTANFANLLDVQPGRAAKGLLVLFLAAFIWGIGKSWSPVMLPFAASLLAYVPFDLKARAMLGDSGANGLGFAAGWCLVVSWPGPLRVVLVAFLVVAHAVAERRSLSDIIDRSPWLRAFDRWGR